MSDSQNLCQPVSIFVLPRNIFSESEEKPGNLQWTHALDYSDTNILRTTLWEPFPCGGTDWPASSSSSPFQWTPYTLT